MEQFPAGLLFIGKGPPGTWRSGAAAPTQTFPEVVPATTACPFSCRAIACGEFALAAPNLKGVVTKEESAAPVSLKRDTWISDVCRPTPKDAATRYSPSGCNISGVVVNAFVLAATVVPGVAVDCSIPVELNFRSVCAGRDPKPRRR